MSVPDSSSTGVPVAPINIAGPDGRNANIGAFDSGTRVRLANSGLSPVAAMALAQPLFVPVRGFNNNWQNFGGTQAIAQVNMVGGVVYSRGRLSRTTGLAGTSTVADLPTGFEPGLNGQETHNAVYFSTSSTVQDFASVTFNPTAVAAAAPIPAIPGVQGLFNGATTLTSYDINGQFKAAGSVEAAVYQRNAAVSDDVAVLFPPNAVAGGTIKVVFFFHGAGDDYLSHISSPISAASSQRLARNMITALLADNWVIISSSGGAIANHWGNPASWDATQAALSWLRNSFTVAKVTTIGQSMGGLSSLRALAYDPLGITNWAGIYPACNLQSMFDGGTYTAAITTAFGGAPAFAANVTACDPIQFPTSLYAGKRILAYASPADTAVPKATNADALATKVTGTAASVSVVATTGNHGDTSNWTAAIATAIVAHLNS